MSTPINSPISIKQLRDVMIELVYTAALVCPPDEFAVRQRRAFEALAKFLIVYTDDREKSEVEEQP